MAQSRHEQQLARTQLTALAQTLAQAVDRELDHARAQLQLFTASRIIDEQDWAQLHAFGEEATTHKPGSLLALVRPDGQLLLNTGVAWGTPLPNLWRMGDERREAEWEGRTLPLSSQSLTRDAFTKNQVIYSASTTVH